MAQHLRDRDRILARRPRTPASSSRPCAAGSTTPRSINRLAQTDVTPLVDEYTRTTESAPTARPVVASAVPPHRSTTGSPSSTRTPRRRPRPAVEVLGERVEHRLEAGPRPIPRCRRRPRAVPYAVMTDAQPPRYTHGHHEAVLRSHRWRTVENSAAYLRAAPRPGTRRSSTSAAARAPSPSTSRPGSRPAQVVGIDAAPAAIDAAERRTRDAKARPTSSSAPPTSTRSTSTTTPSTSCTRTRCSSICPTRSARSARCGACASRAAVVAARDSDYAAFTWYPNDPDARRVARRSTTPSRARITGSPTRAGTSSRGRTPPVSPTCRRAPRCGASPPPTTAPGGASSGPTGSPSRRSPSRPSRSAPRRVDRARGDGRRWRRWAADPDGWFAVLHGEILAGLTLEPAR